LIPREQRLLCDQIVHRSIFFEQVETWPILVHRFGETADERCENTEDANPSHGRPPWADLLYDHINVQQGRSVPAAGTNRRVRCLDVIGRSRVPTREHFALARVWLTPWGLANRHCAGQPSASDRHVQNTENLDEALLDEGPIRRAPARPGERALIS
jgi:hypothetical protein